ELNGQTCYATKDQVVFLDCYQPHAYSFPSDSQVSWIHFDGLLARNFYNLITDSGCSVFSVQNIHAFSHPLGKLLELFRTASPIRESHVSSHITQMLTELLNNPSSRPDRDSSAQTIEDALAYINEHFAEPLTLEILSRNAHLSPCYFTRIFTSETGFSPHQYLIATRINYAKYQLDTTSESVKNIAFSSGFNSESNFCITFKKWEHMTPSDYRNRSVNGSTV
ncbi:MAG: AraC family transcriptional regulator, partial [Lachnospiraceae bacterium]|nr:AraC family transcriptional regulator [Lachnospiraceae bacterium]